MDKEIKYLVKFGCGSYIAFIIACCLIYAGLIYGIILVVHAFNH